MGEKKTLMMNDFVAVVFLAVLLWKHTLIP
jgi:hypothetical protein